jgi:hypothetical protein
LWRSQFAHIFLNLYKGGHKRSDRDQIDLDTKSGCLTEDLAKTTATEVVGSAVSELRKHAFRLEKKLAAASVRGGGG